ncbi:MAG: hypothetical protein CSA33_04590 [Desulfobulbus propionicus]|nr:MAG: hypothetical protein CSA33_04590 [Desulfobulbus propionicus]
MSRGKIPPKLSATSILHISTFYSSWVLSSLLLHQVGRWLPAVIAPAMAYLFLLVLLLNLSYLSRLYQVRLEPLFQQHLPLRLLCLASCTLLFIGGYVVAAGLGAQSAPLTALHTANLLFFACVLGHWLTTPLKRPAELVPLCLIMTLVDAYSVFQGPTRQLTSTLTAHYTSGQPGPPPLVDFILVKLPFPAQISLMPAFGISDWIVIAMFSGAAAKFGLHDNLLHRYGGLYFPVSAVGLVAAIIAAREFNLYLPALPLIAACFLAIPAYTSPRALRPTFHELPALALCATLAVILVVLVLF